MFIWRQTSFTHALSAFLPRRIRDRVPISAVVGATRVVGQAQDQRLARRLLGLLPVPWREVAELPLRGQEGPLPLLRLRVSGDHFNFLTELDGMAFPRRWRNRRTWPACRCRPATTGGTAREGTRQPHDVMEMATQFFQEQLQSAAGAKARSYLRERGLTPATQQAFRLGFAPESRNALKEFRPARACPRPTSRRAGWFAWRRHPGLLRLVPRPHHVSDPGFAAAASSLSAAGRWRPTHSPNT